MTVLLVLAMFAAFILFDWFTGKRPVTTDERLFDHSKDEFAELGKKINFEQTHNGPRPVLTERYDNGCTVLIEELRKKHPDDIVPTLNMMGTNGTRKLHGVL